MLDSRDGAFTSLNNLLFYYYYFVHLFIISLVVIPKVRPLLS